MNTISTLAENPILLLFVVASIGYFLGNIKIGGNSLGVAAVLFTGIFFGGIDPALKIPDTIFVLGLVLFVYSIGLNSGPAFFDSYKKNGVRDFSFLISMLIFSGLVAVAMFWLFGLSPAVITGIYSGSTTNTPSLAGVIDYINSSYGDASPDISNQAVIGYSLSYPMGVLGSIIAILIMEKLLKVDYGKEKHALRKQYPMEKFLSSALIKVTSDKLDGKSLRELLLEYDWDVVFSRLIKDNKTSSLPNWDTILEKGDLVMVVGKEDDIMAVITGLGERATSNLEYDRSTFDVRRIFLSNPNLAGRTLASLNLAKKFNAVISRIRRGDIDMLATDDTVLELGDRIRFIAQRKDLRALSEFFGDSYTESSKVDLFSFGLGIGLGLVLGNLEIGFGTVSFSLGYAGGPLIMGLILGTLRRTGPVVWTLPYSANITLQQIGLILLLACVGVNSGEAFASSLSIDSIWIILAGTIITILTACAALLIGYKLVKLPFSLLLGIVSNQPAVLDFAKARSNNRVPEFGYSMMFPIASVMKILIAQILFVVLAVSYTHLTLPTIYSV